MGALISFDKLMRYTMLYLCTSATLTVCSLHATDDWIFCNVINISNMEQKKKS